MRTKWWGLSPIDRFWSQIDKSGDCWLWTGTLTTLGYGHMRYEGIRQGVHRLSWRFANGPIPDGLCVLHRCDVRRCANPAHLFLGTVQDNKRDEVDKGRNVRGVTHPRTILTPSTVHLIRWLYAGGWAPHRIARLVPEIAKSSVFHIGHGDTWRSLPAIPASERSDRVLATVTRIANTLWGPAR